MVKDLSDANISPRTFVVVKELFSEDRNVEGMYFLFLLPSSFLSRLHI